MERVHKQLDKIEEKVDRIGKDISEIKVEQAQQLVSLVHHIKRSDALEDYLDGLRTKVNYVEGALKLIGFISVLVGTIGVLFKIFHS